jgi:opacity protein-like surface antigen
MKTIFLLLLSTFLLSADPKDMKELLPPAATPTNFYTAVYGGAEFAENYGDETQSQTALQARTITTCEARANCCTSTTKLEDIQDSSGLDSGVDWVAGAKFGYNFDSSWFLQPAVESEFIYLNKDSAFAGFINGVERLQLIPRVTPYVGIGVGAEDLQLPRGRELDFAGQAFGGLDLELSSHWSVFSEYKFIDALAVGQIQQHVVVAGVKYNF